MVENVKAFVRISRHQQQLISEIVLPRYSKRESLSESRASAITYTQVRLSRLCDTLHLHTLTSLLSSMCEYSSKLNSPVPLPIFGLEFFTLLRRVSSARESVHIRFYAKLTSPDELMFKFSYICVLVACLRSGPLLFSLYINDLQHIFLDFNINSQSSAVGHLLYADDLQVYTQKTIDELNERITTLVDYR